MDGLKDARDANVELNIEELSAVVVDAAFDQLRRRFFQGGL